VPNRVPDEPKGNHSAAPAWFSDGSACPPWCARGHMRALQEGATLEGAAQHVGRPSGGHLPEIRSASDGHLTRPGGGGWDVVPAEDPMLNGVDRRSEPAVELELRDGRPQEARVRLTSGEARTLAAQLVHTADQLDLCGVTS
jgi:hypothetical protein